jgi:short-subunit dehydrogenase
VIPGLIDTEIFDRAFDEGVLNSRIIIDKVPLAKWPASKAAHAIYQGIQQGEETIIFPLINRILLLLYRWFPKSMSRLILTNMR